MALVPPTLACQRGRAWSLEKSPLGAGSALLGVDGHRGPNPLEVQITLDEIVDAVQCSFPRVFTESSSTQRPSKEYVQDGERNPGAPRALPHPQPPNSLKNI